MNTAPSAMKYRKDIDVLRAVAVSLVILYHSGITPFTGGFVGVDVFFVISGFLITNIITAQIDNNSFSFLSFYDRRLRRIYPAVIFLIVVVTLFCYFSGVYLDDLKGLKRSARSALFFFSNVYYYSNAGYFDTPAVMQVFLHTWSLSVEMQFYLAYPVLLFFTYKRWRNNFSLVLRIFTAAFLGLSALMVYLSPSAAFYLLPARVWELSLGGWLAVSGFSPATQRQKRLCVYAGLIMIVAASMIYNKLYTPDFPGFAALLPCIGAACFIAGGTGLSEQGRFLRWLINPVTVFIGLISYSLYLWHWPFMVVFRRVSANAPLSWPLFFAMLAAIFLISAFSWKYIETPIRRSFRGPRRKMHYAVAVLFIALVAFGISNVKNKFILFPQQKIYAAGTDDVIPIHTDSVLGVQDGKPEFLLLGDSHAASFAQAFNEIGNEKGLTGRFLFPGSALLNTSRGRGKENYHSDQEKLIRYIKEEQYEYAYIIMRWSLAIHGMTRGESLTPDLEKWGIYYYDGEKTLTGMEALYNGLRDTIELLKANGTRKIYMMRPIPECGINIPLNAAVLSLFYDDEGTIAKKLGLPRAEYDARNKDAIEVLKRIAAEYDFVEFIDSRPQMYGDSDLSRVIIDGKPLYIDDDHLSYTGIKLFYPAIREAMQGMERE